jgi:hypothetical protein
MFRAHSRDSIREIAKAIVYPSALKGSADYSLSFAGFVKPVATTGSRTLHFSDYNKSLRTLGTATERLAPRFSGNDQ